MSQSRRGNNKCVTSIMKLLSLRLLKLCNVRISGMDITQLNKNWLQFLVNKVPNTYTVIFGSKKCDMSILKDLFTLGIRVFVKLRANTQNS